MRSGSGSFIEAARRSQLQEAASALLAREGFASASVAAVAQEAGVSKGVVLYHFGSKARLLAAVVESANAAAEAFMLERLIAADGALERLRAYVEGNLAFFDEHRTAVIALVEVVVHSPAPNPYAPMGVQARRALRELIEQGQRAGELRALSPEVLATAIRGAIDAVAGRLREEPDLDPLAYGEQLAEMFVRAVRS